MKVIRVWEGSGAEYYEGPYWVVESEGGVFEWDKKKEHASLEVIIGRIDYWGGNEYVSYKSQDWVKDMVAHATLVYDLAKGGKIPMEKEQKVMTRDEAAKLMRAGRECYHPHVGNCIIHGGELLYGNKVPIKDSYRETFDTGWTLVPRKVERKVQGYITTQSARPAGRLAYVDIADAIYCGFQETELEPCIITFQEEE